MSKNVSKIKADSNLPLFHLYHHQCMNEYVDSRCNSTFPLMKIHTHKLTYLTLNEWVWISVSNRSCTRFVLTFLENSALQNASASSRFKPTPYLLQRKEEKMRPLKIDGGEKNHWEESELTKCLFTKEWSVKPIR